MKNKKITIIPLGQNCMPRTILTRWKIKKKKLWGELTYPFDLAVFGVKEITKCLKNDFSDFFDNLEYQNGYWQKSPNCIFFYHDSHFNKNEKDKLINQYKKRIDNFRNEIADIKEILFVQILGEDEDIKNQYNQIKLLRKNKPFKFIVIDTQDIVKNIDLENLFISKIPFPNEEYKNNWWRKQYYNSKEGKAFEKRIADFCLKIISK